MSEKLIESITFKCTYEEKREFEAIARAEKTDISKLSRECMNKKITEVREYINSLAAFTSLTTDTSDTSFELVSPHRVIDVTPKPTGTKKAQLLEQMGFFAVHTDM
ncbi:hypothetical protein [Acinetobacter haemolyticus]|uniref:Uncharacterized protein n=1 Tax=Acinetobacter haemolyticus CIP 64.3 = MTCC 9819 TaxID=1217659 RepID=N9EZC3_ACIHA|nr:hypothetical protein [Acinetobacter haemolyticus]ENW15607.1 hypothetical protein F927_03347 [Acinetobacter haemolyticus CIP 64.3 = MTCC 9819]QXZ26481.1 hypothetical protein I6L22_15125 [Acinetobacter haemolyticus]SPT48670.1 Uncharacterised protein [Acinetobacter haemolyticus]SUU61858.1 Uncharacterised protein [Acinetobacter haemolyticus]